MELLTDALQQSGQDVRLAVTVPTPSNKSRKMLEHLHHKYVSWQVRWEAPRPVLVPALWSRCLPAACKRLWHAVPAVASAAGQGPLVCVMAETASPCRGRA